MKSVVFSSKSGQTEKLANAIKNAVEGVTYFGEPSEKALENDVLFVGSWAIGNSCAKDIKDFLESLKNKKVFLFMTAGYGDTQEFLEPILVSMKENLNDTNEYLGGFICQGEVSPEKLEALKANAEKYESMKVNLEKSIGTPTKEAVSALEEQVKSL